MATCARVCVLPAVAMLVFESRVPVDPPCPVAVNQLRRIPTLKQNRRMRVTRSNIYLLGEHRALYFVATK